MKVEKNKRCPLQKECERKCEHVGAELNCDYYKLNGIGDNTIPDQESLRKQIEALKEHQNFEDEIAAMPDEEEETPTAENRLVYLPIGELYPHPDNPRKELGDLTELADSIKAKGVMQNLTVVPRNEGGYTVIIGHRRMGASKLAGLTELPCVIVEMSAKDQIATMLLENMQRSDLTMFEQAQGMQLMFDLGETVEGISEKTGFSQTTVRRRLKMAELNLEALKKIQGRQISLTDFDRLARIEDVKKRNELLDDIGTSNFEYRIKDALKRQDEARREEEWRVVLTDKGLEEIPYSQAFNNDNYYPSAKSYVVSGTVAPKDHVLAGDEHFFAFNRGTVYFRRRKTAEDSAKLAAEKKKREKEIERKDALTEAFKSAFEMRRDYILDMSEADAKRYADVVLEYNVRADWDKLDTYSWHHYSKECVSPSENYQSEFNAIADQLVKKPHQTFLRHTYARLSDAANLSCKDYAGCHQENKRLSIIYDFLTAIGYEMSDAEISLMDGTHIYFGANDDESDT